ncbi:MAG: helix-turn-helix protein [Daejeonella sp.]|nr:helix-turn-helix protein [Daejeonella sp.]
MSSNIRISRICLHCGKEFTAKTTVTKYCSDSCAKRAYKSRIRNSKVEISEQETKQIKQQPLQEIKEKEYLTVKDAAKLLNCTTRAVNKMVTSGRLPASKISERKTLIRKTAIEKLFEMNIFLGSTHEGTKKKTYNITNCYTIAEAEEVSQLSSKALYDYIKRNNIPKIQKGKFVYVPKELIDPLAK